MNKEQGFFLRCLGDYLEQKRTETVDSNTINWNEVFDYA